MTTSMVSKNSPATSAAAYKPTDLSMGTNTNVKASATSSAGVRPPNFLAKLMEDAKQEDLRRQIAEGLERDRLELAHARFAAD